MFATEGTARYLTKHGVAATEVGKISNTDQLNLMELGGRQQGRPADQHGVEGQEDRAGSSVIRKASVQRYIPCLTSLDTAAALLRALRSKKMGEKPECLPVDAYMKG